MELLCLLERIQQHLSQLWHQTSGPELVAVFIQQAVRVVYLISMSIQGQSSL